MTARLFAVKAPPSLDALPASSWLESVCEPKRTRILHQRDAQAAATQLLAEILLRYALHSAYGLDRHSFTQACTEQGKPYFTDPAAPQYSLSHSGSMALCAVHRTPVGADVERIRPVTRALARRIMSDSEYGCFYESNDKDRFFFTIWTLKESYGKQTGQGIACDLQSLSFTICNQQTVSFNKPHYAFRSYSLPGGYQAGACLAQGTLPENVTCVALDALVDFSRR